MSEQMVGVWVERAGAVNASVSTGIQMWEKIRHNGIIQN